jgi:hypothetical protein
VRILRWRLRWYEKFMSISRTNHYHKINNTNQNEASLESKTCFWNHCTHMA